MSLKELLGFFDSDMLHSLNSSCVLIGHAILRVGQALYADDLAAGFAHEDDARRFRDAMRERIEERALSLYPDKTRRIAFGRCAAVDREKNGLGKPETFNFLEHVSKKLRDFFDSAMLQLFRI